MQKVELLGAFFMGKHNFSRQISVLLENNLKMFAMSQVLTRKVVISKFYGKISVLVTVPAHLENLCSIRIF